MDKMKKIGFYIKKKPRQTGNSKRYSSVPRDSFSVYDAETNVNARGKVRISKYRYKAKEIVQENNKESKLILLNPKVENETEIILSKEKEILKENNIVEKKVEKVDEEIKKVEKEEKPKGFLRVTTVLNLSEAVNANANVNEKDNKSHSSILIDPEGEIENSIEEYLDNKLNPKEKRKKTSIEGDQEIKGEEVVYKFLTGYSIRPRDDEEGEDACFACERGLGVADGVSGWSVYGINPANFSRDLMFQCEKIIRETTGLAKTIPSEMKSSKIPRVASYVGLDFQCNTIYEQSGENNGVIKAARKISKDTNYNYKEIRASYEFNLNPLHILTSAYERVLAIGSSTAVTLVLNKNKMEAVNLGDSGFIRFTLSENEYIISEVSKEQQHEFNVPFQMSRLPTPEYLLLMEKEKKSKEVKQLKSMIESKKMCNDSPEVADHYTKEVHENDILILGTDGFFDNLFSNEIKEIVRNTMRNVENVSNRTAKVYY